MLDGSSADKQAELLFCEEKKHSLKNYSMHLLHPQCFLLSIFAVPHIAWASSFYNHTETKIVLLWLDPRDLMSVMKHDSFKVQNWSSSTVFSFELNVGTTGLPRSVDERLASLHAISGFFYPLQIGNQFLISSVSTFCVVDLQKCDECGL